MTDPPVVVYVRVGNAVLPLLHRALVENWNVADGASVTAAGEICREVGVDDALVTVIVAVSALPPPLTTTRYVLPSEWLNFPWCSEPPPSALYVTPGAWCRRLTTVPFGKLLHAAGRQRQRLRRDRQRRQHRHHTDHRDCAGIGLAAATHNQPVRARNRRRRVQTIGSHRATRRRVNERGQVGATVHSRARSR